MFSPLFFLFFASSGSYFSMGEVTCKDQDRVVKATAYDAKATQAGVPVPPRRPLSVQKLRRQECLCHPKDRPLKSKGRAPVKARARPLRLAGGGCGFAWRGVPFGGVRLALVLLAGYEAVG